MKNHETENHEREEDFFVHAQLKVLDKKIENVLCKVFLPESVLEKPLLKFKPTKEQFQQISASYEGALEAAITGFNKKLEVSLAAPNVYFSDMHTKYWGPDFSESSLSGEPQHLHIVRYLDVHEEHQKTSLTMWLSPNPMLGPAITIMSQYDGNVKVERIRQLEYQLSENLTVKFDKHFKHKNVDNDNIVVSSNLVACMDIDIPAKDKDTLRDNILSKIDAFLTIASFGSRTRTACVGWQASDHQVITNYYRGDFTFPTGESEPSFDQGLVWLKDFEDFLYVCYPAFLNYQDQEAIRKAIFSIVPGRKKVLEESFLSMFAGLESLILGFRRKEKCELVVDDAEKWNSIKKQIKKNIFKTIKSDLTKDQRCYIYGKLEDLNRIPLQVAFENFCNAYDIDFSDLWPLFRRGNIIGLSEIRNNLIHGDEFLSEYHDTLWVAEENLKFMLERALLKILGWPIKKTEVSKENLIKYSTAIKMLPDEQEKISKYYLKTVQVTLN